jgi:hypothetical protein
LRMETFVTSPAFCTFCKCTVGRSFFVMPNYIISSTNIQVWKVVIYRYNQTGDSLGVFLV